MADQDLQGVMKAVIQEFLTAQAAKAEPAAKAELAEERRRREELEKRVNELAQEAQRAKQAAEAAERDATIRGELQRLGVAKVELAYKAVKDSVVRGASGELVARDGVSELGLKDYLQRFVTENPELVAQRGVGGSGVLGTVKTSGGGPVDLGRLGPGMSQEELAKARAEIARLATQALRG